MGGLLSALCDREQLLQLNPSEREQAGLQVAQGLGNAWQLASSAESLEFVHAPTHLRFAWVPGGTFTMGLRSDEAELIEFFLGRQAAEQLGEISAASTPTREVTVAPFLCGSQLLSREHVVRLAPHMSPNGLGELKREAAVAFANQLGFRLPSDAELEWLARQGGSSPFVLDCVLRAPDDDDDNIVIVPRTEPVGLLGVHDLFRTQWAADDWFPNHEGAPTSSAARTSGDPQGVRRFEEFDFEEVGDEAVVYELAARRDPGQGRGAGVRLALSWPRP